MPKYVTGTWNFFFKPALQNGSGHRTRFFQWKHWNIWLAPTFHKTQFRTFTTLLPHPFLDLPPNTPLHKSLSAYKLAPDQTGRSITIELNTVLFWPPEAYWVFQTQLTAFETTCSLHGISYMVPASYDFSCLIKMIQIHYGMQFFFFLLWGILIVSKFTC